jgi:hypothetical protein
VARSRRIEQREDVEEVAADQPGRAVVVGELPAVGLDARKEDEGALDALSDPELALQELGVRERRSGSLDRGDRVCPAAVERKQPEHAGPIEDARDRLLGCREAHVR